MRIGVSRRLVLAAGVAALGGGVAGRPEMAQAARPAGWKPKVVTTFTIIQDIAANVAGSAATVESVTRPGAEIHDYQPTPQDVVRGQEADLLLWNGMGLERWFERFVDNARGIPSAVVSDGVVPMPISEGPYQDKPNPHAWMSPGSAVIYIENVRRALAALDPANAPTYAANAQAYTAQVRAMEAPLRARLAGIPEAQRWLVTSEGAFSYLARDLGMREAYLWPINADQQGTPQQIRRLIDTVRRHKVPVVFSESTVSDRPARQVARETGARYGGVLYVDSLSEAGGPVPTYLKLLEVTVDTIARGFGT
jgi:manganese/iron transport system substrate-binding protein